MADYEQCNGSLVSTQSSPVFLPLFLVIFVAQSFPAPDFGTHCRLCVGREWNGPSLQARSEAVCRLECHLCPIQCCNTLLCCAVLCCAVLCKVCAASGAVQNTGGRWNSRPTSRMLAQALQTCGSRGARTAEFVCAARLLVRAMPSSPFSAGTRSDFGIVRVI